MGRLDEYVDELVEEEVEVIEEPPIICYL